MVRTSYHCMPGTVSRRHGEAFGTRDAALVATSSPGTLSSIPYQPAGPLTGLEYQLAVEASSLVEKRVPLRPRRPRRPRLYFLQIRYRESMRLTAGQQTPRYCKAPPARTTARMETLPAAAPRCPAQEQDKGRGNAFARQRSPEPHRTYFVFRSCPIEGSAGSGL